MNPKTLLENQQIEIHDAKIIIEVRKANYTKALLLSKKLVKNYPNNALALLIYATQIGDSVVSGFDPKADRVKKMATEILKPLLRRLSELPKNKQITLKNEYYWFSGQALKQYRLGLRLVKHGDRSANYCMGVGACSLARRYKLEGKERLSKLWAQKSVSAWKEYFKYRKNYYNAYTWFARAYSYLDNEKLMMQNIQVAMKLSGKKISFIEFKEIINEYKNLK